MAELAGGRASLYGLLVSIFGCLPDEELVRAVKGRHIEEMLDCYTLPENPGFKSGVDRVRAYATAITALPDNEVLNGLCVDRTRLLRASLPAGILDVALCFAHLFGELLDAGLPVFRYAQVTRRHVLLCLRIGRVVERHRLHRRL